MLKPDSFTNHPFHPISPSDSAVGAIPGLRRIFGALLMFARASRTFGELTDSTNGAGLELIYQQAPEHRNLSLVGPSEYAASPHRKLEDTVFGEVELPETNVVRRRISLRLKSNWFDRPAKFRSVAAQNPRRAKAFYTVNRIKTNLVRGNSGRSGPYAKPDICETSCTIRPARMSLRATRRASAAIVPPPPIR
jgi:hypothetical protein